MGSLVLELQKEAIDNSLSISDLLRKAFVVAKKLSIHEFEDWIKSELHGYTEQEKIPKYRRSVGQVKVFNPYRGWQDLIFEDHELAEIVSKRYTNQPIAEIENLAAKISEKSSANFQIPFPKSTESELMKDMDIPLKPTLFVDSSKLHGILETVRNIVLDWALKLEGDGILGEGMTFSEEEKNKATSTTYNIQNFTGIAGNVNAENIQIGDDNSLYEKLKGKGVSQEDCNDLESILGSLSKVDRKQKESLVEKGLKWLNKHKTKIGSLYSLIERLLS